MSGLVRSVTKVETGCLRMTKVAIFVVETKKVLLRNMETMKLCLDIINLMLKNFWGGTKMLYEEG